MAIIRWNPLLLRPSFRSLFEDEKLLPEMTITEGLDVYETDNDVVIKASVPGVPTDKVEVTFEDGVLRITGSHQEKEEEKKKKKVVYKSQRVTAFDYTTTLPRAIDASEIKAEVENGVLTVKAPIAPAAKPKKITVKTKAKK